jgi:5-methylcytosine-specific restriction endonuclease McrA
MWPMPKYRMCRKCGAKIETALLAQHQAMHRAEPPPPPLNFKRPCNICKQLIPASEWIAHRDSHSRPPDSRARRVVRDQVFRRDGYRCQHCGRSQDELALMGLQLEAHHVDSNAYHHTAENLLSLCSACHPRGPAKLDKGKQPLIFTHKLTDSSPPS